LDYNHLLLDGHIKDITKEALHTMVEKNKEAGLLYVSVYKKAIDYVKLAQTLSIIGIEYTTEKLGYGTSLEGFNLLEEEEIVNALVSYLMYGRLQNKLKIFEKESKKNIRYPKFAEEKFIEAKFNPGRELITKIWLRLATKIFCLYETDAPPVIFEKPIDRKRMLDVWLKENYESKEPEPKIIKLESESDGEIENHKSPILLPLSTELISTNSPMDLFKSEPINLNPDVSESISLYPSPINTDTEITNITKEVEPIEKSLNDKCMICMSSSCYSCMIKDKIKPEEVIAESESEQESETDESDEYEDEK
jgi:hypothetical protein